jgi:serine/threonine protein kinase
MPILLTIPEPAVCRRCHATIIRKPTYRGYCLRCIFGLASETVDLSQEDKSNPFVPYKIETGPDGSFVELGRGSMGITYRAFDTNLQFPVALKVLNFHVVQQEIHWARFRREAHATARLQHPHVVSVLHYDTADNGQCYYVMDLVEGETLAERVRRSGPLPVTDALEVVTQVASALQAAEKGGLVHRDLKPSNLMLVDGPGINVKVIDFGLAKIFGHPASDEQITYDGFVGTPAFASPEQLSGNKLDQRSDYFSLGCTLFYLVTATPPFEIDHANESQRLITGQGRPLPKLKLARIPGPVRRLLHSLLSASPEQRPQNGEALTEAITKCRLSVERAKSARIKPFTLWCGLALLALIIAGVISLLRNGTHSEDSSPKSIAVLPFENLSPFTPDAYFADGVQDDILTNLGKIADLRVISRDSVQAYRNSANRPPSREIGRELDVRYLLDGSVQREGDRVRVTAQLEEAETGRTLWAERYDGQLTDIFAIQTELAETVSQELRLKVSSAEKASLKQLPTHDLAAYQLYLHAKALMISYHENVQGWEPLYAVMRLLEEAVTRDPAFAIAWCQLAATNDALYWYNADRSDARKAAAEEALQKALSLQPDDGQTHLAFGVHLLTTTGDYGAIRREFELARGTLPNSVKLFAMLAMVESRHGEWRDALRDYDKAIALNPKQLSLILGQCEVYEYHRQYEKLRSLFAESVKAGVDLQAIAFQEAAIAWEERGDTTALHVLLDDPAGPLRAIRPATFLRISNALAEHNDAAAERILASDPKQEFEGGQKRFFSRDFLLGWIKRSEGDNVAAKIAYTNARPLQLAYAQKWPDDPNPLMELAITDAALGHKEDALREAHQALTLPLAQDAVDGPVLAVDLAQVYLWVGERESALKQLEALDQVPRALNYGDLHNSRDWEPIRNDPRFQKLLSRLNAIPIVNRSDAFSNR